MDESTVISVFRWTVFRIGVDMRTWFDWGRRIETESRGHQGHMAPPREKIVIQFYLNTIHQLLGKSAAYKVAEINRIGN